MRTIAAAGILLAILAQGAAGCSPTAPSRPPVPAAALRMPFPDPAPPSMLRGTVHDPGSRPLAGVLVQAWSGPEAYATSDANGDFAISGPAIGSHIFHASKEGYVGQSRSLDSGLTFVLEPRRK